MSTIPKSNAQVAAASTKLPLGVTSYFRYWGPEYTLYVDRAKGAYLWDIDGNRYIWTLALSGRVAKRIHEPFGG